MVLMRRRAGKRLGNMRTLPGGPGPMTGGRGKITAQQMKNRKSAAMRRRNKVERAQQPMSQAAKQARGRIPPKARMFRGPRTVQPVSGTRRIPNPMGGKKLSARRPRVGSKSFPSGLRTRMGVAPTPSDRGPRSRRAQRSKVLGPPRVGMRTVKGRGGRRVTIKRPRPRSV